MVLLSRLQVNLTNMIVEGIKGNKWSITQYSMERSLEGMKEITEEEAKAKYVDISKKIIQVVACGTCCGWKCGKEALSLKIKLQQGEIPAEEKYRVQDEISLFFRENGIFNVVPYIHRSEGGMEIEFIATKNKDDKSTEVKCIAAML